MKKLLLCILILFPISSFANQPMQFKCGNNIFSIHVNASETKHAVLINNELTENVTVDEYSYGDLGDAFVITFDVWGANGGMHNHYTTIFPKDSKSIKQVVQLLDADNRPRGDAINKTCSVIK
ncbi:Uncharacterised protein [Yersinia frederiksenii]|uniref:Phage protein n=2 Tax=Yersinia frederiksenii TaxID=29484 RepID=A0A380PNJ8_YERFR|nr:hypothetical protein [Yersinia frederiksenii]ATM96184.1 hypothetical protein CRN75_12930 [Yersinia frederiksenii]KGA50458.1 hypothetical protein DJ58_4420 [Yersinia frederiksenii ATCC 33641]SUP75130.1 Uncharacterised protein [Yersinia frederiksenii]